MVRGGIWEFMNNADGPAFLERELVGLGVDGYSHLSAPAMSTDNSKIKSTVSLPVVKHINHPVYMRQSILNK